MVHHLRDVRLFSTRLRSYVYTYVRPSDRPPRCQALAPTSAGVPRYGRRVIGPLFLEMALHTIEWQHRLSACWRWPNRFRAVAPYFVSAPDAAHALRRQPQGSGATNGGPPRGGAQAHPDRAEERAGQAIPAAVRDGERRSHSSRRGAGGYLQEGDGAQDGGEGTALDHGGHPGSTRCSTCRASRGSRKW
jgi:hypothetical protein